MNCVLVFVFNGVLADAAAVITKLNNRLPVALTAAEQTDVTNIVAQLDAKLDDTAKLKYCSLFSAVTEAIESNDLTDGQFRSILGIA
jgi:hypothetical protein